eukprot:Protomagalhaensia_wolfi_Nauph_80__2907@NODE_2996_length_922_cov_293_420159_g2346_i0_p1_GENE_NODE_2996_length_922_cov_293_420159_g2346_i0NODE_2996_length_922_cov_293_420159_g2346_i0_p1_ORF_typecomplete_len121_score2_70_NODE_2996_length_922_cov_293_420159_g2346_i0378740
MVYLRLSGASPILDKTDLFGSRWLSLLAVILSHTLMAPFHAHHLPLKTLVVRVSQWWCQIQCSEVSPILETLFLSGSSVHPREAHLFYQHTRQRECRTWCLLQENTLSTLRAMISCVQNL